MTSVDVGATVQVLESEQDFHVTNALSDPLHVTFEDTLGYPIARTGGCANGVLRRPVR